MERVNDSESRISSWQEKSLQVLTMSSLLHALGWRAHGPSVSAGSGATIEPKDPWLR